jgi:hypothetical protein
MSFLDALESNLKSLETQDERDPVRAAENRRRREDDRTRTLAVAPYAEQLKNGKYTAALLDHAVRIGHTQRTKVQITWIDTKLRLQAKDRRLELQPTPDGILVAFSGDDPPRAGRSLDLNSDPEVLALEWLTPTVGEIVTPA